MPSVVNDYNKIQINETIDKDPNGEVIKRSLMINIRANDVKEADELYRDLKQVFNGDYIKVNHNEKKNGKGPICERCGAPMISRRGKNGPFWGCITYPGCKFTKPINEIEEIPTIETSEDIPF